MTSAEPELGRACAIYHLMNMRRRLFLLLFFLILASVLAATGALRCSLCGALIPQPGKYYQVEGSKEIYCERCYLEAPRCSICSLPTAAADIDPETGACPKCLAKLPHCKACGKAIVGSFYSYPYAKGVFCADCKEHRHACDICGVPVGDKYLQYPDGRIICSDCGARAVFDVEAIKGIARYSRDTIEKRLGLQLTYPCTVRVDKLSGLNSPDDNHGAKSAPAVSGLYGKELGMYHRENGKSEIVLLFGLPPDLLYEAAAHEYAHAWQAENGLWNLEPELLEGFAQWVAAEVLREKGFGGALEKLETRTDTPYGTGYQRLKSLHQKAIMEIIRQKR
jgi:hypothetical protein